VAELTSELVRSLSTRDECADGERERRFAIVVDGDTLFGIGRMFQTRAEAIMPHIGIFRDLESAEAFLRRDGDAS